MRAIAAYPEKERRAIDESLRVAPALTA